MNQRRGGAQFQGFSMGPRPRGGNANRGSLRAVPPPPSISSGRSGNANFAPLGPRFLPAGASSSGSTLGANSLHGGVGIPPPIAINKQGYNTISSISQTAAASTAYGVPNSRPKTEDEYVN